jgi:hypothetical protein
MGGSGRMSQRVKSARRGPWLRLRAMHPSQNRNMGHPAPCMVYFSNLYLTRSAMLL